MAVIKVFDNRGRLALGQRFASRIVEIDDSDPGRIILTPMVVIPEKEAWLHKNQQAVGGVRAGLDDLQHGRFSAAPPDVDGDLEWLSDVED